MPLTVEELKAQLAEAEQTARNAAMEAAKAIKPVYDWSVSWHNEYVFQASCRLSKKTQDEIAAFKAQFPGAASPVFGADKVHSMDYALIGGMLISVGGGSCILKDKPDGYVSQHRHPRQLTSKEVGVLLAGFVPDSLKAWGL